jgi:glutamine synthetase
VNLFAPGKNDVENLQFITFLVNTMMAVYKYNGLLKASVSSANNAHRLGAHEAPPAIISIFLGKQISEVLNKLEQANTDDVIHFDDRAELKLGVAHLPEVLLDNTDRNRTSPFAFTGNRFEFRAVGSSANCAEALLTLNTAVASQLMQFKLDVDTLIKKKMPKDKAIITVIKKMIPQCKAIHFEGNGYSDEWKAEAQKRGLDCETSVPLIFDNYLKTENIELFAKSNVLSPAEIESRCEVKWDVYTKKIQIESRVLGDLAMNHIVPVASGYQSALLDNVFKINNIFTKEEADAMCRQDKRIIREISTHIDFITEKTTEMIEERKKANVIVSEREKAIAYHDMIVPLIESIRFHIVELELIVDVRLWTLPKYRELLFVR